MNSACQTNSQNWEGEMFLKVVFKQALHPQQTPYAYIHEFASTYKNKSNAFNCANTAVLVKSSCLCVSVWNNNYEPSFPKTDALNWLWNITVSVNVHSCWYKSHLCGCNRDSIYKTCNRWWTKKNLCPPDNAYCYVGTSSAWLIPIWFELQIIWYYLTVNINDFHNWKGFGN